MPIPAIFNLSLGAVLPFALIIPLGRIVRPAAAAALVYINCLLEIPDFLFSFELLI
jgi:hypothetical protein